MNIKYYSFGILCGAIALNGAMLDLTSYMPTIVSTLILSFAGGLLGFIIAHLGNE